MKLILVTIGILSIIVIILIQIIWNDTQEFFSNGHEIGNVLFNLSVGYLSALIFYIIDIWIPNRQKMKKINIRMQKPLKRILIFMEGPFIDIFIKYGEYGSDLSCLSPEQFKKVITRVDLVNDYSDALLIAENRHATYGEYLSYHSEKVEEYINGIFKMPFEYDLELLEILDQIEKSTYHEQLKVIRKFSGFRGPSQVQGQVIANIAYEYHILCTQLKKYMIKQGMISN